MIKKKILKKLESLSTKELNRLAEIMDVGMQSSDNSLLDKDDKILILSTEQEDKIKVGLKKLNN